LRDFEFTKFLSTIVSKNRFIPNQINKNSHKYITAKKTTHQNMMYLKNIHFDYA